MAMVVTPSYANLPERFYQTLPTVDFSQYEILHLNEELANELGFTQRVFHSPLQLAQAYAGHQFGHFVPQLGDGRARLVGDVQSCTGQWHDIHLKGSGATQFSRRGDGLATLDAVLRELLVSEGMHYLGVPTTRTLAVLGTGNFVQREQEHRGAIQVRVAKSHIRVGTFEYFAARRDEEGVRLLADAAIARLYPSLSNLENPYTAFFETVVKKQAELIAKWLQVGFIHGVMNTDNTLVSGETIDYGPCAFMEKFDPLKKFSSIDHQGRYAYIRQIHIIQWNMRVLGSCLLPLFHKNGEEATKILQNKISHFEDVFKKSWVNGMAQKLGIESTIAGDEILIQDFLDLLHKNQMDFTLSFRNLGKDNVFFVGEEFKSWMQRWKLRVGNIDRDQINPIIIPRNHLVEQAIHLASQHEDWSNVYNLLEAMRRPFHERSRFGDLQKPATDSEQVQATFCGT